MEKPRKGLFVGLSALDFIYLADRPPRDNEKIAAADSAIAAGGPATNAAIAFAHLRPDATAVLLSVVGKHPIAKSISEDLSAWRVCHRDLDPDRAETPPVSSIVVTRGTGARSVVSINATRSQMAPERIPAGILDGVDIVEIDGHQMSVGIAIAKRARSQNVPVVVDGGSWKPGFENLLPWVDCAICSSNFYPPGCETTDDVFVYLRAAGVSHMAVTQGEKPLSYASNDTTVRQLVVPPVRAIDTLGAGDIFHGAFCAFYLNRGFVGALTAAAEVASFSCQFFGPRQWMREQCSNQSG